jgi:hypothetical protein
MTQVPTVPTTISQIMSRRTFELGVADARAGRPVHHAYDLWDTNSQWNYERGRAWAVLTPASVQLKRNGKITPEAISWFARTGEHPLIRIFDFSLAASGPAASTG